eukprot:SAG31_NODE_20273_length_579_cov_0.712500_1_plen_33_part_10
MDNGAVAFRCWSNQVTIPQEGGDFRFDLLVTPF